MSAPEQQKTLNVFSIPTEVLSNDIEWNEMSKLILQLVY